MRNIINIEEAVRVSFKIEPLHGNTKAFEEQIKIFRDEMDEAIEAKISAALEATESAKKSVTLSPNQKVRAIQEVKEAA